MATLALAVAGAAVGSALLPSGVTVLGATLSGAAIGAQVGAFAGSYVDQALFAPSGQTKPVEGPRLSELHVTASTEGAPIPRLYGRARVGGQVIWATKFEEDIVRRDTSGGGGGKGGFGGGGGGGAAQSSTIEYRYFANFAVALAEGEISGLGRVWADGKELDLGRATHRLYKGDEAQLPDSLIEAREGAGKAPAYRGLAYIVFERLALRRYGNRLPQLSFEVYRAADGFAKEVRAVVLIPGSGEFVYATTPVTRDFGGGKSLSENVHTRQGGTDWTVSLDQLEATLPNAKSASLIVSWFGTDLRAGVCEVKPGVDLDDKMTKPISWTVAGVERADAYRVTVREGRAAYGGTPSDQTVVAAIRDLVARGINVTLTPFILMDIPEGNTKPDPYGGGNQAAYPWRGRITVHPAAGQVGSPDKTLAAAAQVAAFVGTSLPGHFSLAGDAVVYSGPMEWSYRRMVLHHAWLAKAAGGVSAFVIGTEMRGLSWVRDSADHYPFVDALIALAADVKTVLGPGVKVTYAADWSEYFGHQPGDGTGDVYFHLDPLWASPNIDAVGIDVYWPLADWRDGRQHADWLAGTRSIHDLAYLQGNVRGGEGFDWYYANQAARDAQARTPITDGAGKPWVFRFKDIRSWWENPHYHRPGGIEAASPTAWVPQSKPFWLMEIGCPAVDKGANQPNVFVDAKSSESTLPYYSRGIRDDLMQRSLLQAMIGAFDPASARYIYGNPVSTVYGGRMVDPAHIHAYCWDARPYPAFPFDTEVWGDGDNWRLGHWLNGRAASVPLASLLRRALTDYGFAEFDATSVYGAVPGYVIDRVMAAREALQPLELAFFFDSLESGGDIVFRHRGLEPPVRTVSLDDLVEAKPGEALLSLTRGQETELPLSAKITYVAATGDYRKTVAEARRQTGASGRVAQAELPIILEAEQASTVAETWLFEAWAARERAAFALPPSALALEPGDMVAIETGGGQRLVRITDVGERGLREIEGRSVDPAIYEGFAGRDRTPGGSDPVPVGQPVFAFLDLPLLRGDESETAGYVAATQDPWPGGVAVYGSPSTAGFVLKALAAAPGVLGVLLDPLSSGPVGRFDKAASVRVKLDGGALLGVTRLEVLAGKNAAAVRNAAGAWEVFQFETALLVEAGTYRLSGLLRGQAGTEGAMGGVGAPVAAGARVVLLDEAVATVGLASGELRLPYNWRVGPAALDIGDAAYVSEVYTFQGIGQRPLSPAHVRGRRAGGDLTISWVRRTRIGGDGWEPPDVPFSEESERYEVDILDGATVKRTVAVASPVVVYTQAQQVADFGSAQAAVTVRVYQVSASFGRGSGKSAVV